MPKQHCKLAQGQTKASKNTQDIKMTDNAATGEGSTVDVVYICLHILMEK